MATTINPVTSSNGTAGTQGGSTSTAPAVDKLANEQTFLQLFVSQLQNQDPLNPADGTQFVSQLAQFSQLEQMIGIGENVGAIRQQIAPATTSSDQSTGSQSTNGVNS
jgi:flagellar basal-body rod modification protein FlgD